ncbi:hypothetical protein BDV95DRAFT_557444 [Massariosphaeria phaeospora]|uniref:Fumarylacetoacetase-like C-terminal domain-containing protein n=1 Tax=Massariosphaeria phaeospora TaxID=100035 RepID=A0A7C8MYZ4_9PLEO|nr:hypothetical protein BDV95DRAFT_557444 [Massariosphaeria phaeospora]
MPRTPLLSITAAVGQFRPARNQYLAVDVEPEMCASPSLSLHVLGKATFLYQLASNTRRPFASSLPRISIILTGKRRSCVNMAFERLIRFKTDDGKTLYGNLTKEVPTLEIEGTKVEVLDGDIESGFKKTGNEATVSKLLAPLPRTNIFMCVGLNYKHHATEAKLQIPTNPAIFTKPPNALAGPLDDISIHPDCQSMLDYEGELTVVIGRDAKNVKAADALSYVLGYTVGNDVSARNFQLPVSVCGGQFGYAKSFDSFAPIGPAIVSTSLIPDPQKLEYTTKVNGEVRQQTGTDDMIYTVAQIIEHLTRGTTLKAGTVIMTGTPSGVGLFREPKGFLKDGDTVEITVEGIGSLVNKMKFE